MAMKVQFETDRESILDLVHDRWFDLNQVKFNETTGEVTIRLGDRRKGPYNDRELRIIGVLKFEIKDVAQIGIYDLCDIHIDESSPLIRITSGFPLEIMMKVGEECTIILSSCGDK